MSAESRKLIHDTLIPMRWGDMDALGHLNNTYYFRYMEQARVEWLDALAEPIAPGGIGPVIAHIACDFKRELVYPATIRLCTYVTQIGRSSMKLDHEFRLATDEQTVYATGHAVLVWVDYSQGGSVPVPDGIRRHCQQAVGLQ